MNGSIINDFVIIAIEICFVVLGWKIFNLNAIAGWKILIPLYNMYLMCHVFIKHNKKWWFLFIPFYNMYVLWHVYQKSASQPEENV